MEQEKIPEQKVEMKEEVKQREKGEIGIGEDKPQVGPALVKIVGWRLDTVKNKEGKEVGEKVVLLVDHPEVKDRQLELSGAKYEVGDKIKTSGIWFKLDSDGQLPFRSALGFLLRTCKAKMIKELVGKKVITVVDDSGYLVVKAY